MSAAAADHAALVRRFYAELWDAHDASRVGEILHEDFTFRGSLGAERRGHAGFTAYVDEVHRALGDFRCVVEDLVAEADRVFARMTFRGRHRGDLLGVSPTGREVSWAGEIVAFSVADRECASLWALFVDPAEEGRGLGTRLLEAAADWLFGAGCATVTPSTEPGTRPEGFYLARGWQRSGTDASGEVRLTLARAGGPTPVR